MSEPVMTVEEAIAHAREWQQGLTVYQGAQGWRVVCMVLADRVEYLQKIVDGEFPEGCTPADARVLREANHRLIDENALLRKCLERVVNLYLIDDYYHAEQRESLIKDKIEQMMQCVKAEANQIEAGQ